ncbi:MAG: IS91 family transposase [Thermodesulfobacteriota bacterium]|nr:IS91 family transposase [Thermodesulfobacteriota bacterium]
MKRSLEVAHVFRAHGQAYRDVHSHRLPLRYLRVMRAIELCRTAELGGHVDECDHCGAMRISYNSCRNRHCPKCQCLDKERWLEARKKDELPTRYFHVVFTIPEALRALALRNQRMVYNILFKSVSETLKTLCKDPKHLGAEIGLIAILHTWSQTLIDHPHVHCIVPAGGLSLDGKRWVATRKGFFLPVEVLSGVFRGKFLDYLKKAYDSGDLKFPGKVAHLKGTGFKQLLAGLYDKDWVVYCKPPFNNADKVLEYLGRYTHRVALTNDRMVKLEGNRVTIRYRDSSDHHKTKLMNLDASEFIRRFLLHVLPDRFMKIRHYGILSNRNRKTKLRQCKRLLGVLKDQSNEKANRASWQELFFSVTGIDPTVCPHCGKGKMVLAEVLAPTLCRAPP